MARIRFRLLLALAALLVWLPADAQLRRGARTVVSGGMIARTDSLRTQTDPSNAGSDCADAGLAAEIAALDSLLTAEFRADSVLLNELRTDDIVTLDSLAAARFARSRASETAPPADTIRRTPYRKGWFMSDSMSLSKVCWMSTVVPGYGQIYNKQYWKLPVLYGTLGAGLTLFIHENNRYKPLKREYETITDRSFSRTPELNALQTRMIRSNTRRQLYLGLTIASYAYFIGDAAVNYSTNDVSQVKKATTLACIFPAPGRSTTKATGRYPSSWAVSPR